MIAKAQKLHGGTLSSALLSDMLLWPLLLLAANGALGAYLPAPSPLVGWSGRTGPGVTPDSVQFDWLGVSCRVSVRGATWVTVVATTTAPTMGTRLKAYTSDQGYELYPLTAFFVSPLAANESLVFGLSDANATLAQNQTRTVTLENMLGVDSVTTVHGFRTDGAFIADPRPPPARRNIEFVGDSVSAATNLVRPAGAPACRGTYAQMDWSLSYAALLCHHFGASCSTIAMGGRCMMRECGGLQMPDYYKSQLRSEAPAPTHDFGAAGGWRPDAMVIELGTNDERAIHGHPGYNESFANQTVAFLQSVATRYRKPDVEFFLAAGPIRNFTGSWATKAVPVIAARARAAGLRATVLDVTGACAVARLHAPDNVDLCDGCSAHPGVEGHREMYIKAAAVLARTMGW